MQDRRERERLYRRRLALFAGAVLLFSGGLALLPERRHRPPARPEPRPVAGSKVAAGAPASGPPVLTLRDLQLGQGIPMQASDAVPQPPPPQPPEVAAEPPPPAPENESTGPREPSAGADSTALAMAAPTGQDGGAAGTSGEVEVATLALRVRVQVWPQMPAKVMKKRKIDDFVRLQARVEPDGRVREVRVLRSIENCEECVQNAVEAARQWVYEAPLVGGRGTEVWAEPVTLTFTYKR